MTNIAYFSTQHKSPATKEKFKPKGSLMCARFCSFPGSKHRTIRPLFIARESLSDCRARSTPVLVSHYSCCDFLSLAVVLFPSCFRRLPARARCGPTVGWPEWFDGLYTASRLMPRKSAGSFPPGAGISSSFQPSVETHDRVIRE